MAADGLLQAEEVSWGPRGKKTPDQDHGGGAAAAFRDSMNAPLEYSRERDPVHLKAAYLEWTEPSTGQGTDAGPHRLSHDEAQSLVRT